MTCSAFKESAFLTELLGTVTRPFTLLRDAVSSGIRLSNGGFRGFRGRLRVALEF